MLFPRACFKLGVLETGRKLELEVLCWSVRFAEWGERPPPILPWLSLREGVVGGRPVAICRELLLFVSPPSDKAVGEQEGGSSEKWVDKTGCWTGGGGPCVGDGAVVWERKRTWSCKSGRFGVIGGPSRGLSELTRSYCWWGYGFTE